jgi:hypothetical protein
LDLPYCFTFICVAIPWFWFSFHLVCPYRELKNESRVGSSHDHCVKVYVQSLNHSHAPMYCSDQGPDSIDTATVA